MGSKVISEHSHLHYKRHDWMLYAVSTLIITGSAIRLIAFEQGVDGANVKAEALMYGFDASFHFLTTLCFVAIHWGMLSKKIMRIERWP